MTEYKLNRQINVLARISVPDGKWPQSINVPGRNKRTTRIYKSFQKDFGNYIIIHRLLVSPRNYLGVRNIRAFKIFQIFQIIQLSYFRLFHLFYFSSKGRELANVYLGLKILDIDI